MSLRAFHIFFIIVSILFLAGFGVREALIFQGSGTTADILFSVGSFVFGVLLSAYLYRFVSKKKGMAGQ